MVAMACTYFWCGVGFWSLLVRGMDGAELQLRYGFQCVRDNKPRCLALPRHYLLQLPSKRFSPRPPVQHLRLYRHGRRCQ